MKKLLFVIALMIAFVGLSTNESFGQTGCPGQVMSQEWIECNNYVLHTCTFAPLGQSDICRAVEAQRFIASKRANQQQQQEAATGKNVIWVKYRETPVDLADRRFEYLDTSKSSFITGAWYDRNNSYMVIGLQGTYYHYCRMPKDAWDALRAADSFGKHYNAFIKGEVYSRTAAALVLVFGYRQSGGLSR
jgi:KTSC domain